MAVLFRPKLNAGRTEADTTIVQTTRYLALAAGGLLTAVVLVSQTPVAQGQSLADAAKRAEEQRRAHPDGGRSFTDRDLPETVTSNNSEVLRLELTLPILQRYSAVRTAILREMVKSPEMVGRIRAAIGAGTMAGVERVYASEPSTAQAISAGEMTPHEYVVTEAAFMAAVGVLAGKLPASAALAGMIGANVEFLKRHQQDIATLWQEAFSLEEQLVRQSPAAPSK
jgi:hypothetical protein